MPALMEPIEATGELPTPPAPWTWSPTGMLMGPKNVPTVLNPDGRQYRLEGTPVEGGTLEWVGFTGWILHARGMAAWLVQQGLQHDVVIVEVVGEVRGK